MPSITGFVDDTDQLAHFALLETIQTFANANGWETLRYADTGVDNHELILKGSGYSGAEEIFIAFRTYQNPGADWYNICCYSLTGYVPSSPVTAQPGVVFSAVPCHNQRIDYWITLSPQRIAGALKVGTPVYESFYLGKFFPYARPSQYPYPIVCAGMLNGAPETRFSDTAYMMPYYGNRENLKMRSLEGWITPHVFPHFLNTGNINEVRDTFGTYMLLPLEMLTPNANVWGCLEGVFWISGFDNVVENTLSLDGKTYVVIQDVYRTGHNNYYALLLD
ncbi:MAG: hypothetical protein LBR88_07330 [Zoogloeaceae bacterium]|jgi:hypothetical protein|nr:hypothetical protein [Zoogloeaceae bacterium]